MALKKILRQTSAPPGFRRDDESGLTTLEWLLIVAAVAGLAALAVVLVQQVVDDTAEQVSGSSARFTAARVAADEITEDALDHDPGTLDRTTLADLNNNLAAEAEDFKDDCERLRITYSDAGITSNWVATDAVAADLATHSWADYLDEGGCTVSQGS